MQMEVLAPLKLKPFKWRLDWFKPNHFVRFCVETKYVDTYDVFFVACNSDGACRTANSKYFGEKNIANTASVLGFHPGVLRCVTWKETGRRGVRKTVPVSVMESVLEHLQTPNKVLLLPHFKQIVADISNNVITTSTSDTTIVPLGNVETTATNNGADDEEDEEDE